MSDTPISAIDLTDELADMRDEIRLLSIFLRGALDILENDGPDARAAIKANADRRICDCYSALVLSLYFLSERLDAIAWPETA